MDLGPFAQLQRAKRHEEMRRGLNPDLSLLDSAVREAANMSPAAAKRDSELGLPAGRPGPPEHLISPTQLESQVKHELLKEYSKHLKVKAQAERKRKQEELRKWNQDRTLKLKEARRRSKVNEFILAMSEDIDGAVTAGGRAQSQLNAGPRGLRTSSNARQQTQAVGFYQ